MEKYRAKLAKILAASGWSQENLADKLAVTFVTLNKWVNGKAEPRAGARERIEVLFAEILGTDDIASKDVLLTKQTALTRKFGVNKLLGNRAVLDRITVNLTYHSNGTEGSTMTEKDVEAVLFDNKVLRNRTTVEQREAVNHQAALNFLLDELKTQGKKFTFTADLLKTVHLRLMNGIISNAGEYRNHGARIRGAFIPLANYIKISKLIKVWCAMVNVETEDPIRLLAVSHAEFERIHPFSDGNGRTGRLLLFIKALHLGLAPPVINKERRSAYYKYLEICQTRELSEPLEKFIAEAIIRTSNLLE
ncbi:MAG: Fic family protein [Candidatus Margulisbacteria bacterium]|jgi:Fic family protein/DNA-binding XRE family transcriptional regulator|nr:Fic family protein [Candidatus Margulisiibacteriota bacterium]